MGMKVAVTETGVGVVKKRRLKKVTCSIVYISVDKQYTNVYTIYDWK